MRVRLISQNFSFARPPQFRTVEITACVREKPRRSKACLPLDVRAQFCHEKSSSKKMDYLIWLTIDVAVEKGHHVFTRYPRAGIFGRGGVLLTLLFLAVDEEEKRRRLTKASETKVFFIGDSPPDNETAITYH
jgi:hypothetical protein